MWFNLSKLIQFFFIWHLILFSLYTLLISHTKCNTYGNPITNTVYYGTNSVIESTFRPNEYIQELCIIDPYTCFVPIKMIYTYTNLCK